MKKYFFALAGVCFAGAVSAQSLSPEEIARMLDDQASTPNPYAALLNDPDPKRSLGAMKIMMESGDQALVDLALEFGMLSSDPRVRREAVEYYMASEPFLYAEFDGSDVKDIHYPELIKSNLQGKIDSDKQGYVTFKIGAYDPAQRCFVHAGHEICAISFGTNGIFLSGANVNSKLDITEDGNLIGSATMYRVDELVPITIRLLE